MNPDETNLQNNKSLRAGPSSGASAMASTLSAAAAAVAIVVTVVEGRKLIQLWKFFFSTDFTKGDSNIT